MSKPPKIQDDGGTRMPLQVVPIRHGLKRQRSTRVNVGSYSLLKVGVAKYDWTDPYGAAVSLSWPQFLALLFTIYLLVNFVFALLYFAVPGAVANARPGSFTDVFFFSFETLATVGYGEMYPATLYGHTIASAEIMCGITFAAILTGLTFVRFSKPRPKYIFADHPVVCMHNGKPTLMVRVANGSSQVLADAHAKISVLLAEQSAEGTRFRRAHQLLLSRSSVPVFPLTWTLMHEIDTVSPLFGLDSESLIAAGSRFFLSFEARDPALSSVIHDLRDYGADEVLFGMRYRDIISDDEDGQPVADIHRVSEMEPDEGVFISVAAT